MPRQRSNGLALDWVTVGNGRVEPHGTRENRVASLGSVGFDEHFNGMLVRVAVGHATPVGVTNFATFGKFLSVHGCSVAHGPRASRAPCHSLDNAQRY